MKIKWHYCDHMTEGILQPTTVLQFVNATPKKALPIQLLHSTEEQVIIWCNLSHEANDSTKLWDILGRIAEDIQEDMGFYLQSLPVPYCHHYYMSMMKAMIKCAPPSGKVVLVFDHCETLHWGFPRNCIYSLYKCVNGRISLAYINRHSNMATLHRFFKKPIVMEAAPEKLLQNLNVSFKPDLLQLLK